MRRMLFLESLAVVQPRRVDGSLGKVNKPDVEADRQPVACEVTAKREVRIVTMPTVEGHRVEAHIPGDLTTRGEKYAVHSLDRTVDDIGRSEKLDLVSLQNPVGDDAARVADAGICPAHRMHARRSRHADHIPIP